MLTRPLHLWNVFTGVCIINRPELGFIRDHFEPDICLWAQGLDIVIRGAFAMQFVKFTRSQLAIYESSGLAGNKRGAL